MLGTVYIVESFDDVETPAIGATTMFLKQEVIGFMLHMMNSDREIIRLNFGNFNPIP